MNRLLDGWGSTPLEKTVVLISNDRIITIGHEGDFAIPPDCRVIDAHGMTVMPGLIDMHVHLEDVGHTDLHYPESLHRRARTREVMALNPKPCLWRV
jgi:imidazolonepropionase-like amidohydrolase